MTSPDPDYTVERIEPNGKTIPQRGQVRAPTPRTASSGKT